ncbi:MULTISPECIES: dihydroxyacetone kinase subunit DhaK [unclassified Saccharopolyspora]|uniref:dihydroxyacetone kinase subunit DhaK n=1 Tax=unclassified Saccharopolyspora TaxID=2646250 RepID=UPI001CD26042|nr:MULTISPECIES: dihydroxyacetone kinase subunit DhaK [unclassified Saccharopolyspora]MCA1186805.1 dihydroxyacetone kinase subunit DhaK [Saccharopolyspora sp. 6T]MCA1190894.1 dihydroxyacetone kinase subunit DhaK [Saccharopolyspora sp. 6V]MCA1225548.1 dihydroxyacetone kinase subunit DhaK [Saccharopolyspora sp. 6M]MCA1278780.1 dihydroxyacetone kinase subunit DhaK [Saccharopolyspora sp. 7B]
MKKIINDPAAVVGDALRGMAAAHPELLRVRTDPALIVRADAPLAGRVALISGGGSGHEPLHGGFVGRGMLTAAVPGAVFTSPTPDAVQAAIAETEAGAGALLLVKNYTGDVLNFETAAELAGLEGTDVRAVIVDDDVAVKDSTHTAGRRGVGGTVLVEKIVGAAVERGVDLAGCEAIARRVVGWVRSMGVALTGPTVPHAGSPSFTLGDDEVEIGIGIHGEPGRERIPMEDADGLVARLLEPILADLPFEAGDEVLLFTNSMGATPLIELYLAHGVAERLLAERGVRVRRRLVGPYTTSLDMQGMSLTLLKLDDELTELWDDPVRTAALHW